MAPWQRTLLGLMLAAMVWIMVTTWGSVGSAVMAFGLISMGSGLLYQWFLNRDDPDVYE